MSEFGQSDTHFDVTDSIEEFETGKVWHCECGKGIGTEYGDKSVKCADCGRVLVDERGGEREKPEVGRYQSSLAQF